MSLLRHYYSIITSILHHFYAFIITYYYIVITSILQIPYYILLRHYYIKLLQSARLSTAVRPPGRPLSGRLSVLSLARRAPRRPDTGVARVPFIALHPRRRALPPAVRGHRVHSPRCRPAGPPPRPSLGNGSRRGPARAASPLAPSSQPLRHELRVGHLHLRPTWPSPTRWCRGLLRSLRNDAPAQP